jgi:ABC-type multidrug transport system fused ATPase/permease subunit
MKFHILFLVILTIFTIPLLILQNKFGQSRYWLTKYLTPSAREQGYIFSLFLDRKYNKEIRLNQSFNYLFDIWKLSYKNNTDEVLKQSLDQNKKLVGLDILSSLTFAASFFLILFLLSNARIRIGDFVSVMEAIQRVLGSVQGLSYITSNLKESTYYLKDIFIILEMPSKQKNSSTESVVSNKETIIEIKNLEFKYPFSETNILKNINLEVNRGDNIIIVGSNGSGKSTLIKCLIGLYEIPNNKIKLFGKDINMLTEEEIYRKVSVIYQDFGTYEMTAFQNILLGDTEQGEKAIVDAAKKAETDEFISSLSSGYQTRLGRLFESSKDLSGGQWQKIALARAMVKDSELIILDEPTSSLDSIAEKKLFLKFKDITEGKTSIYISHRMYACHLADYIIVLKDGEIIEKGNHHELIEKAGHYKELYNNQSDMYKQGEMEMSYGNA